MKQSLKEWGFALLYALAAFLVLYFLCFPMRISGPSMESTLWDGDRVLVSRALAMGGRYDRGDLVMFSVEDNGEIKTYVKRVIATEGDLVELTDGVLFVNAKEPEEPYAQGFTEGGLLLEVPEDCIFVLGDNREHSSDSRHFGPVAKTDVTSVVLARFYPFDQMERF